LESDDMGLTGMLKDKSKNKNKNLNHEPTRLLLHCFNQDYPLTLLLSSEPLKTSGDEMEKNWVKQYQTSGETNDIEHFCRAPHRITLRSRVSA
jgi:hypothetical protein